jgi:hypothetical protein
MPFDPKAYLAKKAPTEQKSGFDPKAYLASKAALPPEIKEPSILENLGTTLESGLQSFGNVATLGHLPEIQARYGQMTEKIGEAMGGEKATPYEDLKKYFKTRADVLYEKAPTAGFLGGATGMAATSPIGAGRTAAGLLTRAAESAGVGALYGAGINPEVESTPEDPYAELKARGEGAIYGAALGGGAEAGLHYGAPLAKKAGEKLYKSGLTSIDFLAEKFGKKPVSDILMEEGVTGNYKQIQAAMDDLAQKYLSERNLILKNARQGEVDMEAAMKPALDHIYSLKMHGTPEEKQIATILEKRATAYIKLGGKQPEEILRTLPVAAEYKAPFRAITSEASRIGLPIGTVQPPGTTAQLKYQRSKPALEKVRGPYPEEFKQMIDDPNIKVEMGQLMPEQYKPRPAQTVLDVTESKMGPSPGRATKWKSAEYNRLPQSKYAQAAQTSAGQKIEKIKAHGLKTEIEKAVGRASGQTEAERLKDLNAKLSQLLTTKEKARNEALREAKKNNFTSVDSMVGGMAAVISHDPLMTAGVMAAKKAADLQKTSVFKTKTGLNLRKLGIYGMNRSEQMAPAMTRALLYSPWTKIDEEK